MYNIKNFKNNSAIRVLEEKKAYSVIEYVRDLSVSPMNAQMVYFANEMNIRKRQLVIEMNQSKVVTQAGSMQWLVGDIKATTGIKGVGDFLGKALKSTVTKESAIKPEYVELPGWSVDMTKMQSENEFPEEFNALLSFVEEELGVPIKIVSVGPDRAQTIIR